MLNYMDLTVIVSIALVIAAILALCMMFLIKNPRVKLITPYIVATIGLYAASVGIRISLPPFPVQLLFGVGAAMLSVAAIVLEVSGQGDPKKSFLARLLAAAGLAFGLVSAFM